jgi:hypothetical protein
MHIATSKERFITRENISRQVAKIFAENNLSSRAIHDCFNRSAREQKIRNLALENPRMLFHFPSGNGGRNVIFRARKKDLEAAQQTVNNDFIQTMSNYHQAIRLIKEIIGNYKEQIDSI